MKCLASKFLSAAMMAWSPLAAGETGIGIPASSAGALVPIGLLARRGSRRTLSPGPLRTGSAAGGRWRPVLPPSTLRSARDANMASARKTRMKSNIGSNLLRRSACRRIPSGRAFVHGTAQGFRLRLQSLTQKINQRRAGLPVALLYRNPAIDETRRDFFDAPQARRNLARGDPPGLA